jgi:lipoprotein-anchoring transpeptidase ErfK/SrfK
MSDILGDRRRAAWLLVLLLATASLPASAAATGAGCRHCARPQVSSAVAAASAERPPAPADVTVSPPPAAQDVSPAVPVFVRASAGTLTDVELANESGRVIDGQMAPDRTAWRPNEALGYGRTYTLTVRSRGMTGMPAAQTSTFSTLTPSEQTAVVFTNPAWTSLADGATYGVGTVVAARFDAPIEDRAAAERRLIVTTDPPVTGSWYWVDDQTVHWRPERYYAPGTKVTVSARIYGARLGDGLYGQEDRTVSFRIGDAHVSIADDKTKQVSVFDNGRLVRTMPTSMGMGGTETVAGTTLSFWTPPGTYTVLDKDNPVVMDSSTYGLPTASRLGYRVTIPYATRISIDGIYLHQLNATVWAQGNTNTSHGCLNLNAENAKWFFDFSVPGDVVEVRNTGGPPLTLAQNGDWTIPWDQWRKGSALG